MKSDRIKITFTLPNLMAGGAERVISYIAQNLDTSIFNVTLLIIGYSRDASYDVQGIKIIFFEKERVLHGIWPLIIYINKQKPDILVSAVGHLNTVTAFLSLLFPKTKFISREVTVLSLDDAFFNGKKIRPLAWISKKRFHFFDKIICQSQDMKEDIVNNYNIRANKFVVINNPITDSFLLKNQTEKNNPVRYITVGRLSREKGIHRIIKVLSNLDFPFHYTLIGNGDEKENILSLINELGLHNKFTHIEFTKDVSKYLAENDFFLQGSYFEGFPNCLIESCSVGTPVIAFKAPGGTKEIIENNVNGFYVNDEDEFLDKLKSNRNWNAKIVRASVIKKFSKEKIIQQYQNLFLKIVKN
jgi:glycosyltransferase involved in cell wall biosynthesis